MIFDKNIDPGYFQVFSNIIIFMVNYEKFPSSFKISGFMGKKFRKKLAFLDGIQERSR